MSKVFEQGDFRSGYYRDQTFMMAIGELTVEQFFAQLYAHTDVEAEPASAGRSMNGHFSTRSLDENGQWKKLSKQYNSSADVSPTASQMPRLVGLAYASKLYRQVKELNQFKNFSTNGNEIAFATIGNASTSEGMFYESINAIGVLQIPAIISIWDDEYGISVPAKYHTTKQSISEALKGFERNKNKQDGFDIYTVNGWDYQALLSIYKKAVIDCRKHHIPIIIHVKQLTQPQGHSTSGSHERYKSKERLKWESDFDCTRQMRLWLEAEKIATSKEIDVIENKAKAEAKSAQQVAWKKYRESIDSDKEALLTLMSKIAEETNLEGINSLSAQLSSSKTTFIRDVVKAAKKTLYLASSTQVESIELLKVFIQNQKEKNTDRYNSYLYSQSNESASNINFIKPVYSDDSKQVDGREVLQACFDYWLSNDPRVFAIGEDVGKIGDVNKAFDGLQEKHGELRVTDTGIREVTIVGQGIGAAMRGLKPIVEIQYLDYILYATQILSDDLATLQYRTKGGQKAPLIVRTRGHRLEGIWHAGSPMGHLLTAMNGIHILVPRNMTQAAGFYNTLMRSDEPAIVVECLNGYRLKELLPTNIGEFTIPLGVPETIIEGTDITVVSYGSILRVIEDAAKLLADFNISIELIDVQTLIPFDTNQLIANSIKKTNRVIFIDEDMPGAATAYMMQNVLEQDDVWSSLDSKPVCLSSKPNRPAYGTDGDYFSKPNSEDVFETIYEIMHESKPSLYPAIF